MGTDVDGADEDGGSADIDVVFEDRAAVVGRAAIAEGGAVAEDAVGTDDGAVVDDEPLAVMEGETGTDSGEWWDFDAEDPLDGDPVEDEVGETEEERDAVFAAEPVGEAEGDEDDAAFGVLGVGGPVGADHGPEAGRGRGLGFGVHGLAGVLGGTSRSRIWARWDSSVKPLVNHERSERKGSATRASAARAGSWVRLSGWASHG